MLDRSAWRKSRAYFINEACNALLGNGHQSFGVVPVTMAAYQARIHGLGEAEPTIAVIPAVKMNETS
eukprot:9171908-Karenia_brevis.AAC.1